MSPPTHVYLVTVETDRGRVTAVHEQKGSACDMVRRWVPPATLRAFGADRSLLDFESEQRATVLLVSNSDPRFEIRRVKYAAAPDFGSALRAAQEKRIQQLEAECGKLRRERDVALADRDQARGQLGKCEESRNAMSVRLARLVAVPQYAAAKILSLREGAVYLPFCRELDAHNAAVMLCSGERQWERYSFDTRGTESYPPTIEDWCVVHAVDQPASRDGEADRLRAECRDLREQLESKTAQLVASERALLVTGQELERMIKCKIAADKALDEARPPEFVATTADRVREGAQYAWIGAGSDQAKLVALECSAARTFKGYITVVRGREMNDHPIASRHCVVRAADVMSDHEVALVADLERLRKEAANASEARVKAEREVVQVGASLKLSEQLREAAQTNASQWWRTIEALQKKLAAVREAAK